MPQVQSGGLNAPGAGESGDPPDPFTIKDWAVALVAFLDALGIANAHVLGLSWGGLLAQELYRLDPRRCLTLTLADTDAGWKGSLGGGSGGATARSMPARVLAAGRRVRRAMGPW